ncbi:hypothetical protein GQ457_16G030480 [Hibiscus cannabinus]
MKTWLICLMLIGMLATEIDGAEPDDVPRLHPGVLDPCKRPGGPHPGCHPDPESPPIEANSYDRGCSKHNRCRG